MESNDQQPFTIDRTYEYDDRQYKPVLKPVSPSCSGDSYSHTSDESITKVQRQVILTKTNDKGFGFSIIGGTMGEAIFVSFILAGGSADVSKKLFKGDQILKVNGFDVDQLSHNNVVQLLKDSGQRVSLVVIHKPEEFRNCESHLQEFDDIMQSSGIAHLSSYHTMGSLRTTSKKTLYVRSLFHYDVNKDCGLPNKGLSFKFGDILHVTNASDPEWWQARKVNLKTGEDDTDLGIIPSKNRVERKNKSKMKKVRICTNSEDCGDEMETDEFVDINTLSRSVGDIKVATNSLPRPQNGKASDGKKQVNGGLFSKFKGKSKSKDLTNFPTADFEKDLSISRSLSECETFYQPVVQEENLICRPVIMLGVAKEEFNCALLRDHSIEFGVCIPHTTRPPKGSEDINGKEFYFVSVKEMQSLITDHQFIETGKNGNHLYGTSIQAVLDVAESGRHCILDISCMAVKRLCRSGLWPIVILVQIQSPNDYRSLTGKSVSDEQIAKFINKISKTKLEFLPYITRIISGSDFDSVYQQILQTISINSGRKIWLPSGLSL